MSALPTDDDNVMLPIVFCLDGTGSMGEFFMSLAPTFEQVISLLRMLTGRNRVDVRIAVYHDFDDRSPRSANGGYILSPANADLASLRKFMRDHVSRVAGGGATPEAQKTAFNCLLRDLDEKRSIIIHYTDAPPHYSFDTGDSEGAREEKYLAKHRFETNWIAIGKQLRTKHRVVTITNRAKYMTSYVWCGDVVRLLGGATTAKTITATTMEVLLTLLGHSSNVLTYQTLNEEASGGALDHFIDEVCTQIIVLKSTDYMAPALQFDLAKSLFQFDAKLLLETFENLVKPSTVMSLTTNPVFGKFWRLVCSKVKAKFPEEVQKLCDTLSQCVLTVSGEDQAVLQQFLADSYNQLDDVRVMLAPFWRGMGVDVVSEDEEKGNVACTSVFYIPEALEIDRKDLLNLIRGGSDKFGVLVQLINSVAKVEVTAADLASENRRDELLPTTLSPAQLFAHIPHLLFPGTKFAGRGALIIAALSLSNSHLQQAADTYLRQERGKWINWKVTAGVPDVPENWALSFFRVLALLEGNGAYLTAEETLLRDKALKVMCFRQNLPGTVAVTVGSTPDHYALTPDRKMVCESCQQPRSASLMAGGKCGICHWNPAFKARAAVEEHDTKSHMARCHSCAGQYAIARMNLFNRQDTSKVLMPKCYFCREQDPAVPKVGCKRCKRSYILPSGAAALSIDEYEKEGFTCLQCIEQPNSAVTEKNVPVSELLKQNTADIEPFLNVGPVSLLTQRIKMPVLLDRIIVREQTSALSASTTLLGHPLIKVDMEAYFEQEKEDVDLPADERAKAVVEYLKASRASTTETVTSEDVEVIEKAMKQVAITTLLDKERRDAMERVELRLGQDQVINAAETIQNVAILLHEGSGVADCNMCWSTVPVGHMGPVCGECDNRVCHACVSNWYGCATKGNIVTQAHVSCPYCKKTPKYAVLKRHCPALTEIRRLRRTQWTVGFHHGWCTGCNEIKSVVARECAEAAPDLGGRWMCLSCKDRTASTLLDEARDADKSQKCPGADCGISVAKAEGCNHMECTQCGEHWCWECGVGGFNRSDIYDHMWQEHDSIGY